MLNDFSERTKIIRAALELAQGKDWRDITLAEIAETANSSLADVRALFDRKADILTAFQQEVDKAVLERLGTGGAGQGPRDRVLDAIMTRFEVMAPFRPALAALLRSLSCHPSEAGHLLPSALASQYWMLAGAGVPVSGLRGAVKVAGLTAIYGQAFRFWLQDESPGSEKTMALLDRKLRRGEGMLNCARAARQRALRMACCCAKACKPATNDDAAQPASEAPAQDTAGF
jgi:ubiquinone biosynthesis protein COQ9